MALLGPGTTAVGGCEVYRVTLPLAVLDGKARWRAAWAPLDASGLVQDALDADLYILPRLAMDEADIAATRRSPLTQLLVRRGALPPDTRYPLIDYLRAQGRKVVYEVDDDFTNAHRVVRGGGEAALGVARACDAITVSTPYLAGVMRRATGRPVYVLPNCVDPAFWAAPGYTRVIPNLTIGLSGSPTHAEDWRVLAPVLPAILDRYPHVTVILGGFHPTYFADLPDERVIRLPVLPYRQYPGSFRAFDIALCPVDPTDRFNWSKSGIKALEAMAAYRDLDGQPAGAAVIATDMNIYQAVIHDGTTGRLVAHTPEAWQAALEALIEDAALRRRLAVSGHRWVRKHRDINTKWTLWAKAYRAIMGRTTT